MKLHCAIVDDEPLALSLLESYVNKTPFLELAGKYSSAVQAMKELPGHQIDLLFLDIQMPELNGLEFSKMVDARTRIVFTTAFGQYAIDGYRVNALDYLLKPISYVDFLQAANKALQWFELVQKPEEIDSIFVKSDYKLVQVELKKILYIEGLKDYIKIYTEDAPKPIPITYEYEVHGRAASPPPALYVYTALSLSKRTKYASSTAAASYSIRPTSPSAIATNKLSKLSLTNEVERICS